MSYNRGSYRGSDRGKGRQTWQGRANLYRSTPQNLPPPKPFGSLIDSISIMTFSTEEDSPTIKDVEYVASYNWLEGKSPIILVPGSPPAWAPPATVSQLKPDSGDVFYDINAARYPSYPLEPAFRSLQVMKPDYRPLSVDVVGCGSTFGNLLRFAGSISKSFRFDLDVIGDTVLFVRKEISPTELITDLRGYGHTFPDAYTQWDSDVRNSCSHQRIIQYEFGSLKFLVRTETDGYVKEAGSKTPTPVATSASKLTLDDAFQEMAIKSTKPSQDERLQLRMQGTKVQQHQIFDIKTRATYAPYDMNEILPRLWLNQTPQFLLAYHQKGTFKKPEVQSVRQDIIQWEKENSSLLARFHAIVQRIVNVARDSEQKQCEVSWDGQGSLRITKQIDEGKRALPSDLVSLLENSG